MKVVSIFTKQGPRTMLDTKDTLVLKKYKPSVYLHGAYSLDGKKTSIRSTTSLELILNNEKDFNRKP